MQAQAQALQPRGVNLVSGEVSETDRLTLDDALRQFAAHIAQQVGCKMGWPMNLWCNGGPTRASILN